MKSYIKISLKDTLKSLLQSLMTLITKNAELKDDIIKNIKRRLFLS